MTILLIDSQDKLDQLVERLVTLSRFPIKGWPKLTTPVGWPQGIAPIEAGRRQVYFGQPHLYVANTVPSVESQLRRCLRHHHTGQ